MKKVKGLLAIVLALTLALSFGACGKGGSSSGSSNGMKHGDPDVNDGAYTWYFGREDKGKIKGWFDGVKDTIDPQSVYASTTITADMLTGSYVLPSQDKGLEDVRANMTFKDFTFEDGNTYNMAVVPVGVYFGKNNIYNTDVNGDYEDFKQIDDADVAVLKFTTKEEVGTTVCTYEVKDNKLVFTEIDKTSKDGEPFAYKTSGVTFEYDFAISGPYITLSQGSDSLKLVAYCFSDSSTSDSIWFDCYSKPDSPIFFGVDAFDLGSFNMLHLRSGESSLLMNVYGAKMTDNGTFTFIMDDPENEGKTITKQFAYILSSDVGFLNSAGMVLLDGEKVYMYNDSITDREERQLNEQGVDTADIEEAQLKEIAEKKSDLFDDLKKELTEKGLDVSINKATGEISMDSSVLFGGDSAELTDEGKKFLKEFVSTYTSVIYNEKYDGFIDKTMVEGHIAPISGTTYEGGLPLSEQRAENVKNYILSDDIGVDTKKLAPTVKTVGYSQSKPVYDEDGNVDIDASRRVSFRFTVNTDKQ